MRNFKGFDDYVEIFKGGQQVDSVGNSHDGDALIAKAVASFNATAHEPPAVVGHPKENGPAFGWVEGLKEEGGILLAKFKEVVPEFEEMVQKGMFKKRSASFYPDGRLRHVGFLGAMPPAVKGLTDLKFKEDDQAVTFEFGEATGTIGRIFRSLRDWLIEKDGKEVADKIISNWDVEHINNEARRPKQETALDPAFVDNGQGTDIKENVDMKKVFTEADLLAAKNEGVATGRDEVKTEFAESAKKKVALATKASIKEFVEQGVEKGKIAPAWAKAGIQDFMDNLGSEAISFAENDEKQTPLEWFKEFIDDLPKVVEFKEVATRGQDAGSSDQSAEAIAAKAQEFVDSEAKAGRTINISQAVAHVTKGTEGQ